MQKRPTRSTRLKKTDKIMAEELENKPVENNAQTEVTPEDVQNNKVFAILAYIGILVLVPIFAAKESKFARFHAN